jgi:hypothetical protein
LEQLDPLEVPLDFPDETFILMIFVTLEVCERHGKALRVRLR